jgi:hypothetical protein
MKFSQAGVTIICAVLVCGADGGFSQTPEKTEGDAVRVTVSMNTDGSRTVYKFNDAQHMAIATITDQEGKLREKIRYELDDAGRFSSGQVFGPDGRFRFKSQYKYDSGGHLQEETQSAEDGALLHKIVYSYDQNGKRTGYSIFDASGKLLGRVTPLITGPSSPPKSRERSSR